jgi:hypothetical protein
MLIGRTSQRSRRDLSDCAGLPLRPPERAANLAEVSRLGEATEHGLRC